MYADSLFIEYHITSLTDCFQQCVDIEFAEPQDCPEVTEENCFNSSNIRFANVYMTELSTNLSIAPLVKAGSLAWISSLLTASMLFLVSIW